MIKLPEERSTVSSYNPSLMVLFGKPKSGKSTITAAIDNNLIIDLEDGYRSLSVMKVQARNYKDLFEIKEAIIAKGREIKKKPYQYITIDNATRLEEMAVPFAGELYRKTAMGQSWGLKKDSGGLPLKDANGQLVRDTSADVRMLPNGSGYLYMRLAIKQLVDMFKPLCETLILICHIKDKQIKVNGTEMSEMTVDLAGKTGDIICGEADAIGLIYREGNKTFISFEGGENTLREARPIHLRGKKFCVAESDENNDIKVNLSQIFV